MTARDVNATFRCRLCSEDGLVAIEPVDDGSRPEFYRCRKCGLVNRDVAVGFAADGDDDNATVDPGDDAAPENVMQDRAFRFLGRYLAPPGRLLDIGCGNGRLMVVARKAGWDVKGLEHSTDRAQRVRKRLGAAVVVASLAEIDPDTIDAVKFDVVCLHFGLERVLDGVAVMTKLRGLLARSGHLLLELTNPRSRAAVARSNATNLYPRAAFDFLLRRTGFDLVQWEPYADTLIANLICKYVPVGGYARVLLRKQER